MSSDSVLIVEDDAKIRDMLGEYLTSHGYEVRAVADGTSMREALRQRVPDVVLLDVNLPGEDGFTLARWLRERHRLGIMMVTAADQVIDRIVGLEMGADDYVAKPFDLRELRARLKSLLRRLSRPALADQTRSAGDASRLCVGAYTLDLAARRLFGRNDTEIELTAMEFDLLKVLVENPNRVLSRDTLLSLTRNREWEPFDRSIDIRIARLRRKLEQGADQPLTIKTVRGSGYMLVTTTAERP